MQPLLSNKPQYPTTDISLAAYLHSCGYELFNIDHSDFPTIFYFINSPDLLRSVNIFQSGTGEAGRIAQFYRSYKLMIEKLKNNGNGSRRGNR